MCVYTWLGALLFWGLLAVSPRECLFSLPIMKQCDTYIYDCSFIFSVIFLIISLSGNVWCDIVHLEKDVMEKMNFYFLFYRGGLYMYIGVFYF